MTLMIFCLMDLSISDREVLMSPTVIVDSSIPPCNSLCPIYLEVLLLFCCSFSLCRNTVDFCVFICILATLLNLINHFCFLCVCEFFRIIYKCHLWIEIVLVFYFQFDAFCFFFLITLSKTSSTILIRMAKIGIIGSLPILGEEFSAFTAEYGISCEVIYFYKCS